LPHRESLTKIARSYSVRFRNDFVKKTNFTIIGAKMHEMRPLPIKGIGAAETE